MDSSVRRVIPVPGGTMRLNEYWPIIRHPHFARLFHKRQLGGAFIAFPGARHSRGEHALNVAQRTKRRACQWHDRGLLSQERIPELVVAALLHDIGHGPFSHLIESVTKTDHKFVGKKRVEEMSKAIRAADVDPRQVQKLLSGEDSLGLMITDRNLGTDKLGYLSVDAYHAGLEWQQSFEVIEGATRPIKVRGKTVIGVDIKVIDGIKHLQRLYVMFYKNFYLAKSATIAERLIQEMVRRLLEVWLTEETLWEMIDGELEGAFFNSNDPAITEMASWYKDIRLPKAAVIFRHRGYTDYERIAGKPISVATLPTATMERLPKFPARWFARLQTKMAQALKLPQHHVLVVPPVHGDRFIPRDVILWDTTGTSRLWDRDPDHFASLRRDYLAAAAMRVCVPEHRRVEVAKKADLLQKITIEFESTSAE